MLNIYNIMIFKSKNGYKYDIDAAIFDIMFKCTIFTGRKR